ncbi:MAG TPA: glycosyltransferase family 2 protein [Flavobacteriaceae bacterium]|nr:glycosyltransferase family 2 protein [Flavobacteriaceae bacterium]
MKTAVVILNWNGKNLLEKFLPSVVSHSKKANIYVADNASTDDSVDFLKENFPEITILQNNENGGYAKGYNDALSHLEEEILILLNSDVEVTSNWLAPIVDCFEKQPNTAAVQPKILDYKNKEYFEYAGAAGGFIDQLGYPFCRGRIFDTVEKDEGQYNDEIEIFWASGACLAIRKKVFEEVGKLDEAYFAHQEEIDLCWRIRNFGYQIKYTPKSTVYHVGGATLKNTDARKTYYNFRNSLFNLVKNFAEKKWWVFVAIRLVLDGVAGIHFLIQLKPKHTWAIVSAHFSFWRNLRKMLKKRKGLPKKKIKLPIFSVVYHYYVQDKKTYAELFRV